METVLQEFRERTQQKKLYHEIDMMRKEEDTDWIETTRSNQRALWNVETDEYIFKNPYYAWRLEIEYESVPLTLIEWIQEAKGVENLQKVIELARTRIEELNS